MAGKKNRNNLSSGGPGLVILQTKHFDDEPKRGIT